MPRVPSVAARQIGEQIAAVRIRAGLTQDQVGVRSEIDSANVRAYEAGRAMPSIQSLVRIAAALDVPPGMLLEGVTPESFPPAEGRRRGAA